MQNCKLMLEYRKKPLEQTQRTVFAQLLTEILIWLIAVTLLTNRSGC